MNWAIIDIAPTIIVLGYEDEWDYDEAEYDNNFYWHLYEDPNLTKLGQELIQHAFDNLKGDVYLKETGAEILEIITKEIEKRGLGAIIETGD